MRWHQPLACSFGLLAFITIAVCCYASSFWGERIWDDHFLTGDNPFFRGPCLWLEAFRHWLYPFATASYYRPVQNVSYMLDYWIWGENFAGYHFTNAVLHAVAAFLLAQVLLRVGSALEVDCCEGLRPSVSVRLTAWLTAGFWLVHPIHHAAVAYVAGRADSLAAAFCLGGWLCMDKALRQRSGVTTALWSAVAAVFGVLGLCAKEIAICWFVLFTFYCIWVRPVSSRKIRLTLVAGCWVIVLGYWLHRVSLSGHPNHGGGPPVIGAYLDRFILATKALGDYVSILLFPVNLHMERSLAPVSDLAGSWRWLHSKMLWPLGACALVGCATLWLRASPRRPTRRFAICWFFIGFLPISNLIPLNAQVAEHWIYMPSAGFIFLAIGEIFAVRGTLQGVRCVGLASIYVILIVLTHEQSRTWVSEEEFLRTTMTRGGDSPRIRSNLARVLARKGKFQEAESIVREALVTSPDLPMLRVQLAEILSGNGNAAEAAELVAIDESKSDRFRQQGPMPWLRDAILVDTLFAEGKDDEARDVLALALTRNPYAWHLVRTNAMLQQREGNPEIAIKIVDDYLEELWWHREPVIFLAQHLATAGRYDAAVEKYQWAAKLDIRSPKPWEQIAAIRLAQGRPLEALEAQKKAVKLVKGAAGPRAPSGAGSTVH